MNLFEKISKVQAELKAPKGQFNSFGKYKYRSCEDIVEAVKPLLSQVGLVLGISDDIVLIGERYYVKAEATLIDIETGEKHSISAFAREEMDKKGMDASQLTGSCSSYARKYALNGLLAIDDTKDSDSTNTHGKDPVEEEKNAKMTEQAANGKIDDIKAKTLIKLAEEKGVAVADIEKGYGCKIGELSLAQWTQAISNLNKRKSA